MVVLYNSSITNQYCLTEQNSSLAINVLNTFIMKKNYFILILILSYFTQNTYSQTTTNIPDPNFEQALIDLNIDSDMTINATVLTKDISSITYLDVSSKNISDLTGIQDFISLTGLQCYSNQLTTVDVTKNTALTFLNFNDNQLTGIDVSNNTLVTTLGLAPNLLTSLDISKNTALSYLQCQANQLTTLDVTKNTALSVFLCFSNQLTDLDVSQNTALTSLNCGRNQLTTLDVGNNLILNALSCDGNLISSLNLDKNTALTDLNCGSNPLLTSLDITNNTNLTEIWCNSNPLLTSLDLSNNTVLDLFYGPSTPFTSLDFSKNTALTVLNCGGNQLLSLNLKNGNNSSLIAVNAISNFLLKCIQVDDETAANAAQAPYTNWIKDATTFYSEDCQAALTVDDELLAKGLSLYPNPVSDILTIDSEIPLTKVEIYSMLGKKVKEINSDFKSIHTDSLSNGVYIVRIHSEKGLATKID